MMNLRGCGRSQGRAQDRKLQQDAQVVGSKTEERSPPGPTLLSKDPVARVRDISDLRVPVESCKVSVGECDFSDRQGGTNFRQNLQRTWDEYRTDKPTRMVVKIPPNIPKVAKDLMGVLCLMEIGRGEGEGEGSWTDQLRILLSHTSRRQTYEGKARMARTTYSVNLRRSAR